LSSYDEQPVTPDTPETAPQSPDTPEPAPQSSDTPKPALVSLRTLAIFAIGVLLGAGLGIAGTTLFTSRSETTAARPAPAAGGDTGASQGIRETLEKAVTEQTRHFRGDPDAPITIIEFSDFKCGFCGRFATETSPQLEEAYIESGVVRFGYQSIAILSEESVHAAEAGECAADQEAFWPYHDLLFAQLAQGNGNFSRENLKQFAADLDLDTATFNECLDSGKYTDLIRDQTMDARSIGIQSTPTFLINGRPFIGAQPFEAFQQVIEAEQSAGGQ
jgi:protein-disulfide isomerase